VKKSIQKSAKKLVSRCGERSKKFLNFFDFNEKPPALLIDFTPFKRRGGFANAELRNIQKYSKTFKNV
jgi:hypothetical protein